MPAAPAINLNAKPQNKKIVFDDEGEVDTIPVSKDNKKPKKKKFSEIQNVNEIKDEPRAPKNKKIVFDDDGEAHASESVKHENGFKDDADDDDYFAKREKQQAQKQQKDNDEYDSQKKWYHVYPQYPSTEEVLDMKESEQMELYNTCKTAYDGEQSAFSKRNPSDARWLETALHKGTAKDRGNAGALLVASNPLGNLEALSTLIGYTKLSNKSSTEVISILTDLWQEVLLPPHRKMLSLSQRGADWKLVRKDTTLSKEQLKRIYAYWFFENELKDNYFEFLKNLQQGIQTGLENNKNNAIIASAQLLAYAPEKEQMLLTMLVNKLGDPLPKVASKALHHLTEVAHKHPNMCAVIVTEAEKLLFRNNISDRAQHFALCFLASLAPAGNAEVCTKLVHICFALFKVLVQKGAVNTRMMQAILRCLQKAILEAAPAKGSTEVLSKEMQDTVYRLVHLADIRVSVQTLGLLLQLITVKTEKSDRFYNALYVKLLDMELVNLGSKTAAQLLHIVHRAIHIDANLPRAQAFIKRLLQLALYMPPHIAAGCLIVLNKLLRSRKELQNPIKSINGEAVNSEEEQATILPKVSVDDEDLARFDSDGEEKYEDIKMDDNENERLPTIKVDNTIKEDKEQSQNKAEASWHHTKIANKSETNGAVREISASKYDPYHRVPAFSGAELALRNELLLLREHFHPTVQVFADSILNDKRIAYYGDPLRDFSLPHFLERFAFKNPKKQDADKSETGAMSFKRYVSFGPRGKPVKQLTKENCTEDEMFILNYLQQKREQAAIVQKPKTADDDSDEEAEDGLKPGEVDDDEFDDYLDGFFGKKSKKAAKDALREKDDDEEESDEEELDFLKELGGEMKETKKAKKNAKKLKKGGAAGDDDDEDENEIDADWGDDDVDDDEVKFQGDDSDVSDDDVGSIDADDDNNEEFSDDGSISMPEDDDDDNEDDDDDMPNFDDEEDSENLESGSDFEDGSDDEDDDELASSKKSKKSRMPQALGGKSFAKTLKHSDGDMSSLFAAADDFAELLEETGKSKGHGTTNAIFNKDKSSDKQMKWEEKRRSNSKQYGGKTKFGKSGGGGGKHPKAGSKKNKFNGKKRKN